METIEETTTTTTVVVTSDGKRIEPVYFPVEGSRRSLVAHPVRVVTTRPGGYREFFRDQDIFVPEGRHRGIVCDFYFGHDFAGQYAPPELEVDAGNGKTVKRANPKPIYVYCANLLGNCPLDLMEEIGTDQHICFQTYREAMGLKSLVFCMLCGQPQEDETALESHVEGFHGKKNSQKELAKLTEIFVNFQATADARQQELLAQIALTNAQNTAIFGELAKAMGTIAQLLPKPAKPTVEEEFATCTAECKPNPARQHKGDCRNRKPE